MCRRNPLEDYLGKREKETTEVSDVPVPSVKKFFQELAFWLFDKFYEKCNKDEDLKIRLSTILGYLEDPSLLHKLWEGDKFEYQDINCAKESLDIHQQFECLHSLYSEDGHVRSTFGLTGCNYYQQKKRMIAAIDSISMAFKQDVEHHSGAKSHSWVDREDDVEEFMNWLQLQRDILSCPDNDALTQLVTEFKRQVQATIDEISTEKERAKTTREQNGTLHPTVAYAQECIASNNLPPDYEEYMRIIVSCYR